MIQFLQHLLAQHAITHARAAFVCGQVVAGADVVPCHAAGQGAQVVIEVNLEMKEVAVSAQQLAVHGGHAGPGQLQVEHEGRAQRHAMAGRALAQGVGQGARAPPSRRLLDCGLGLRVLLLDRILFAHGCHPCGMQLAALAQCEAHALHVGWHDGAAGQFFGRHPYQHFATHAAIVAQVDAHGQLPVERNEAVAAAGDDAVFVLVIDARIHDGADAARIAQVEHLAIRQLIAAAERGKIFRIHKVPVGRQFDRVQAPAWNGDGLAVG